jgi:hypothetical protein
MTIEKIRQFKFRYSESRYCVFLFSQKVAAIVCFWIRLFLRRANGLIFFSEHINCFTSYL